MRQEDASNYDPTGANRKLLIQRAALSREPEESVGRELDCLSQSSSLSLKSITPGSAQAATRAVGLEVPTPLPLLFVATTFKRSAKPRSALVGV
jgi:hypothetical protein